jgi:hypothetical protein
MNIGKPVKTCTSTTARYVLALRLRPSVGIPANIFLGEGRNVEWQHHINRIWINNVNFFLNSVERHASGEHIMSLYLFIIRSINMQPKSAVWWRLDTDISCLQFKCKGTRKLATARQLQFLRKITDFKQATDFQISKCTPRKLMFK